MTGASGRVDVGPPERPRGQVRERATVTNRPLPLRTNTGENTVDHPSRLLSEVVKKRDHVPNEQAVLELLYMAALNAQKNRGGRYRRRDAAPRRFAVHFEERIHE